jgi:hypothetical protein
MKPVCPAPIVRILLSGDMAPLVKAMASVIMTVIKPAKARCASIPSNRRVTSFLGVFA